MEPESEFATLDVEKTVTRYASYSLLSDTVHRNGRGVGGTALSHRGPHWKLGGKLSPRWGLLTWGLKVWVTDYWGPAGRLRGSS